MKNVVLITLIILMACNKKKSDLEFEATQIPSQGDDPVSFQELQKKIILPHCIRCHATFVHESEVKKLLMPGRAEESHFFTHIRDGEMPPDRTPLGTSELEIVRSYIDNL